MEEQKEKNTPDSGTPPQVQKLSLDKYRTAAPGLQEAPVQVIDEETQTVKGRIEARKRQQEHQPKLSREQIMANDRLEREVLERNRYIQTQNFGYLDVFEKEQAERKQAQNEFRKEMKERQAQVESRKPAFFQKSAEEKPKRELTWREEEHEAFKKLKKTTEMDFDPDTKTHEELREFFKVANDKGAVKDMTEKMFESTTQRMKTRSNEFYAFLNKQFNIMNFKSARCSMHCFDSPSLTLTQVQTCLQTCRQGITECRDYAHNLQKDAQQNLQKCITEAADQRNLTDPIVHFVSCYEQTLKRYDSLQEEIEEEFSNFV